MVIVDRALAIAMGEPRGPIYLSLPREALAAPLNGFAFGDTPRQVAPAPPAPATEAIERAAAILAKAERPLIVTARAGRAVGGAAALAAFAEQFAMPVVEFWPAQNSLPTTHPMHGGFDVALAGRGGCRHRPRFAGALDSSRHALPPECPVIQIGPDPAFTRLPMRGFPATLAIQSETTAAVHALHEALAARLDAKKRCAAAHGSPT